MDDDFRARDDASDRAAAPSLFGVLYENQPPSERPLVFHAAAKAATTRGGGGGGISSSGKALARGAVSGPARLPRLPAKHTGAAAWRGSKLPGPAGEPPDTLKLGSSWRFAPGHTTGATLATRRGS